MEPHVNLILDIKILYIKYDVSESNHFSNCNFLKTKLCWLNHCSHIVIILLVIKIIPSSQIEPPRGKEIFLLIET